MKSVYIKALLLSIGILVFSLAGFLVISRTMTYRMFGRETPIGRNAAIQFEEAGLEYENGGAKALSSYLGWQRSFYPRLSFYYVRNGRDLVTGADRSELLRMARSRWSFLAVTRPIVIAIPSPASRDAFVIDLPPEKVMFYLDYYLLLLGAITILCWGLALQFASPLNQLAEIVRRFGAGDLSARVRSSRRDGIGDVGRAFDQMADRTEKFLTAERRLLQDISHELRSPLARLSFAAELARTSPDREAAAMRVNKEIDQLTDLVQSLLQVTREEGDLSDRKLESVALDDLVQALLEDCEIEATAQSCRLVSAGASHAELLADPVLLRRALENILRNAIAHAPFGSRIEIALGTAQGNASVTVRDYGAGVPEEALTQIFKPFFRVDSSRNADSGGVGLGLAIAQRAINIHYGRVWAENAEPGLRVSVQLPLDRLSATIRDSRAGVVRATHPAERVELGQSPGLLGAQTPADARAGLSLS
jgi:two-component system sensor histidine kinase CpxA